jgi:prevent-host-death family protein
MGRMSVAEAKARFAEAVKKAESGERVLITRYGSPVVALVPLREVEQLRRLRTVNAAQGLAGIAGGWRGSGELASDVARVYAERTAPRGRNRRRRSSTET